MNRKKLFIMVIFICLCLPFAYGGCAGDGNSGGDTQVYVEEPFFFATHPQLQKRIENCKGFLAKLKQPAAQGIRNKEVFLDKTYQVILYNASLDLKAGRFRAALRGAEKYLTIRSQYD